MSGWKQIFCMDIFDTLCIIPLQSYRFYAIIELWPLSPTPERCFKVETTQGEQTLSRAHTHTRMHARTLKIPWFLSFLGYRALPSPLCALSAHLFLANPGRKKHISSLVLSVKERNAHTKSGKSVFGWKENHRPIHQVLQVGQLLPAERRQNYSN